MFSRPQPQSLYRARIVKNTKLPAPYCLRLRLSEEGRGVSLSRAAPNVSIVVQLVISGAVAAFSLVCIPEKPAEQRQQMLRGHRGPRDDVLIEHHTKAHAAVLVIQQHPC